MTILRSGDPGLILGQYRVMMEDLNEYVLVLDNFISNLQKLYKTSGPTEHEINKDILFRLNDLLEMHNNLQICLNSKKVGFTALNDANLISDIK